MIFTMLAMLISSEINVQSIGVGKDLQSAKKDAFRNAVEKSVGIYIDSKSTTINSMLINDSILNFSNGYIKNYDILEKNCNDSLCTVKISASVENDNIKKRLGSIGAISAKADKIGAIVATKEMQAEQKSKLLEDLKHTYFKGGYTIEFRDFEYIQSYDDRKSRIQVNMFVSLNDGFIEKTKKIFNMISINKFENEKIEFKSKVKLEQFTTRVDFVDKKSLSESKSTETYILNSNDIDFFRAAPNMTIKFKDASNHTLDSIDEGSSYVNWVSYTSSPQEILKQSGIKIRARTEDDETMLGKELSPINPFINKYHTANWYANNLLITTGIRALVSIPVALPKGIASEIATVEIDTPY